MNYGEKHPHGRGEGGHNARIAVVGLRNTPTGVGKTSFGQGASFGEAKG